MLPIFRVALKFYIFFATKPKKVVIYNWKISLKYKEFRSKLDIRNKKISSYIEGDSLMIENVMHDFFNYISAILRNSCYDISYEDIEEIIVDVVFTVWKNKDKLDESKRMSSYIAGITKNLMKKKYRDEKRLDGLSDNIEDYEEKLACLIGMDDGDLDNDISDNILRTAQALKPEDKNIFIDYYYSRKSIKEISSNLSMSESKVKSKLYRIRKKIKKELKESGYDLNDWWR